MTATTTMMNALIGKTIRFGANIEECESYAEEGIMAVVTGMIHNLDDPTDPSSAFYKIKVDFEPFDAVNRAFETGGWYIGNTKNTGTCREAHMYNSEDTIYMGEKQINDPQMDMFTVVGEGVSGLMDRFIKSGEKNYVMWLEQQVIAAK